MKYPSWSVLEFYILKVTVKRMDADDVVESCSRKTSEPKQLSSPWFNGRWFESFIRSQDMVQEILRRKISGKVAPYTKTCGRCGTLNNILGVKKLLIVAFVVKS
ncbi:8248_t:CDS:2 [Cetraspora pellucida]|uniref:8248_t:CDS:1 n=1 Tax=Cetraspora pellucida TaxID=1433469 RepID=A0A9N9AGI5_9GLOM|nr:8248_t:CDS:2 [Cetraspora pellucida]